jgi:hypothetical protein
VVVVVVAWWWWWWSCRDAQLASTNPEAATRCDAAVASTSCAYCFCYGVGFLDEVQSVR